MRWMTLAAVVVLCGPVMAQKVLLGETVKAGECFQYDLSLALSGKMKLDREGKQQELAVRGQANHTFTDRIENTNTSGAAGKVYRHYTVAKSAHTVAGDGSKRELGKNNQLIGVVRSDRSTLHFSPAGPLSREELELVAQHFDTLAITGLLPGTEVAVDGTWAVSSEAIQQACLFDGIIKNDVKGKLTAIKDGVATWTLTGTAEGLDTGATARVSINATGTFDMATSRITGLDWEQTDDRDLGPASPAMDVTAKISLKRTVVKEPAELNADVRSKLPTDKIPETLLKLQLDDASNEFVLNYARDWSVIGRASTHTVLRLLQSGDFVGQATVTNWSRAGKGEHTKATDFVAAINKTPGWEPLEVVSDGEQKTVPGNWVHRYSVKGKRDGATVVQTFYFVAGANGQQLLVTFLSSPEKAADLAKREQEFIDGLTFRTAK
jgi:hypothetical protein